MTTAQHSGLLSIAFAMLLAGCQQEGTSSPQKPAGSPPPPQVEVITPTSITQKETLTLYSLLLTFGILLEEWE